MHKGTAYPGEHHAVVSQELWERVHSILAESPRRRGEYATISEIASAEKNGESYVGRVLRLTLLAPDLVEGILNGRPAEGLQLDGLMRRLPVEWTVQSENLG